MKKIWDTIKIQPAGVILKNPLFENSKINKGAVVLTDPDYVCLRLPKLKKFFFVIERRGWCGVSSASSPDIKLIDDFRLFEKAKKIFHEYSGMKSLNLGAPDFVDTEIFKPLGKKKEYDCIHLAGWQKFRRHELIIEAAKLLPEYKFLKFGHFFPMKGQIALKKQIISSSPKNITYPFRYATTNLDLIFEARAINALINKAKIGIISSPYEGINRFKLECMSAGIVVLVPADAYATLMKHVNKKTAVIYQPNPDGLAKAIKKTLKNLKSFDPRSYILQNTGMKNSLKKLITALNCCALEDKSPPRFNDIYYNGRNEELIWGHELIAYLKKSIKKYT